MATTKKTKWWALVNSEGYLSCYDDEEKITLYSEKEARALADAYGWTAVPAELVLKNEEEF